MDLLERAIQIAVAAHRGQRDRYGAPYILHPLRVMALVDSVAEKTVAILHDVVEDSEWTFPQLREEGFPDDIVTALDCLTKREGEPYEEMVKRCASHPLACTVKLADLEDNMDVRRMPQVTEEARARLERFRKAWATLQPGA